MSRLRVAPIVEGHGEYQAIRTLLRRVWTELLGGEFIDVIKPIRWPKSKLVREHEISRATDLALRKLAASNQSGDPMLVLLLLDADRDPACILGPQLRDYAARQHQNADIACVLAVIEYETWFVASAESLQDYLDLPADQSVPQNPEEARLGKAWIDRHFRETKYSETVDQPRLTSAMDLQLCRRRSRSFDKLCRELERRLQ